MIQFLMAAAPAAYEAAMAGFGARGRNEMAEATAEAQRQQAEAQIRLNQQAAAREWAGQQQNYNQQVEQAALKHVDILKKRIRSEGSFGAQEGRAGKSFKRAKTILATGAAGFDMAALNKSTESAKEATLIKMESTAKTLDQRNNQALAIIKPYMRESVFGAIAGSLAKSGVDALSKMSKYQDPMGKAKEGMGADKFAQQFNEAGKYNGQFSEALTGLNNAKLGDFKFDANFMQGTDFGIGNTLDFDPFGSFDALKLRRS